MNPLYTKLYNYLEKANYTQIQLAQFTNIYNSLYTELNIVGQYSDKVIISMLATIITECGRDMLPVKEIGGNTQRYNPYFGRGYIQLTWKPNYQLYGYLTGNDLVNYPDLATTHNTAIKVLILYYIMNGLILQSNNFNWIKVRQFINGGNGIDSSKGGTTNGLDRFVSLVNQFLSIK